MIVVMSELNDIDDRHANVEQTTDKLFDDFCIQ